MNKISTILITLSLMDVHAESSKIKVIANKRESHQLNYTTKTQTLSFKGKVVDGKGESHQLICPTANLYLNTKIEAGTYASIITWKGKKYKGLSYADRNKPYYLYNHFLEYSPPDLQDQTIHIELVQKISNPIIWDDKEDYLFMMQKMSDKISKDIAKCKEFHRKNPDLIKQ